MFTDYFSFEPSHLTATKEDFIGNGEVGRYVILTGSDQRAMDISLILSDVTVKSHPRQHNLYLGNLPTSTGSIQVATISTGMGCPSLDIIFNELIMLGAKRFLRIGTAGSLQPNIVKTGDVVIATAAVRDECTSKNYICEGFPAIASLEYVIAAQRAASNLNMPCHSGIVHTKSSLYAREFKFSFLQENIDYMQNMHLSGVLASEMETSHLFILASLYNYKLKNLNITKQDIFAGSVLGIVGDNTPFSNEVMKIQIAIDKAISLGIEAIKEIYLIDSKRKSIAL